MANLSSVDFSTGVLSSATTGTVMTINAVAAAAGTPAAFAMTIQKSSLPFSVTQSSAITVSLTSGIVSVSSVAGGTIAVSSIAGGTITTVSAVTSLTSGTVVVSSITGGTITTIGSISSGTIATVTSVTSGSVAVKNGANTLAVDAFGSAKMMIADSSGNAVTYNNNGQALSSNSQPEVLASNHPTICVGQDTSQLTVGVSSNVVIPSFAVIGAGSSGNTAVVALSSAKKIRVLAWDVTVSASVDLQWQNSVSSNVIAGPYHADGVGWGIARSFNPVGYFQTASSEGLNLNLSAASSAGGVITYILV